MGWGKWGGQRAGGGGGGCRCGGGGGGAAGNDWFTWFLFSATAAHCLLCFAVGTLLRERTYIMLMHVMSAVWHNQKTDSTAVVPHSLLHTDTAANIVMPCVAL